MNRNRMKFAIAGLILIGSLTYLAVAATRGGYVYHVTVDKFQSSPQYRAQRIRLCGTVDSANCIADSAALSARFNLKGTAASVVVQYHGTIPDLFKAGREVVVEGQLDNAGVFQADVLMTKCASKYETDKMAQKAGSAS